MGSVGVFLKVDDFGCGFSLLIALAVIIIVIVSQSNAKDKARKAYQDALRRLKADPANPDLRQQTLNLGRVYSNLTRNMRGVSLFDEVALMNDINAACAAAATPRLAIPASASVESRLESLAALKSKGLIDEREYAERRREILNDV